MRLINSVWRNSGDLVSASLEGGRCPPKAGHGRRADAAAPAESVIFKGHKSELHVSKRTNRVCPREKLSYTLFVSSSDEGFDLVELWASISTSCHVPL